MSNAYGVRPCRGHWHVTVSGEDIAAQGDLNPRGDCFSTEAAAQAVADKLNRNPDDPSVKWATAEFKKWLDSLTRSPEETLWDKVARRARQAWMRANPF